MKHPVLKVKKDAEQDVVFHYKREERLAMPSAPRGPTPAGRGFLRGILRRGRLPIFLPLLAIVIAMVMLLSGGPRGAGRAVIAGWEAVLRATPYEDSLLVSVTFLPEQGRALPSQPPVAAVTFVLPDTGETLLVSGDLGQGPSTLRGKMRYIGTEKKLTAQVRLDGRQAGLTVGVKKPGTGRR